MVRLVSTRSDGAAYLITLGPARSTGAAAACELPASPAVTPVSSAAMLAAPSLEALNTRLCTTCPSNSSLSTKTHRSEKPWIGHNQAHRCAAAHPDSATQSRGYATSQLSESTLGTHLNPPPLVADLPRVQRPPPVCPRRLNRRSRHPTVRSFLWACQAPASAVGYFGPTLTNCRRLHLRVFRSGERTRDGHARNELFALHAQR